MPVKVNIKMTVAYFEYSVSIMCSVLLFFGVFFKHRQLCVHFMLDNNCDIWSVWAW